jgi:hypothetical protein
MYTNPLHSTKHKRSVSVRLVCAVRGKLYRQLIGTVTSYMVNSANQGGGTSFCSVLYALGCSFLLASGDLPHSWSIKSAARRHTDRGEPFHTAVCCRHNGGFTDVTSLIREWNLISILTSFGKEVCGRFKETCCHR